MQRIFDVRFAGQRVLYDRVHAFTDQQLLREYAEGNSEAAFAELVRRHINLVYSAALRTVRDAHQAQDVTQSAFIALAQHAPRLKDRPVLSGWLYSTAQHLAAKVVRSEVRRRAREQEVTMMNKLLSTETEVGWDTIAPHFDQALQRLSEPERDALLLRYFEGKSTREMAQILQISDEAAQKRANRAVERLRTYFSKRGIAVGASSLTVAITSNAIQAAPLGLATTVSSTVTLAGTALHTSTLMFATKTFAMTTFQKSLIALTCVAVAGTGIYETYRASTLQKQLRSTQQERDSLREQVHGLQTRHDQAVTALAAANDQLVQSRSQPEILRLRAEVGQLRSEAEGRTQRKAAEATDPTGATAKSWLTRVDQLKKHLETASHRSIPELQLLTEKDWLDAVKDVKLEKEADFRQALSELRSSGKKVFGERTREALTKYLKASGGVLPSDWSQLKPYYETPLDDDIFQRYTLLQTGKLSDVSQNSYLFAEKASPVDDEYDYFYQFNMNGTQSRSINPTSNVIEQAAVQFANANQGRLPTSPDQLEPYFTRPIDSAEVQKTLDRIPPGVKTLEQLKSVGTLTK